MYVAVQNFSQCWTSYATSFRSNEPARYSHIRLISFKIQTRRRRGILECNRAIQLAVSAKALKLLWQMRVYSANLDSHVLREDIDLLGFRLVRNDTFLDKSLDGPKVTAKGSIRWQNWIDNRLSFSSRVPTSLRGTFRRRSSFPDIPACEAGLRFTTLWFSYIWENF